MIERQSGITMKQMHNAPNNATFIWPNERLYYPSKLAKHIGRGDLILKPISWLRFKDEIMIIPSSVVIDHACCEFSRENLEVLDFLKNRVGVENYEES